MPRTVTPPCSPKTASKRRAATLRLCFFVVIFIQEGKTLDSRFRGNDIPGNGLIGGMASNKKRLDLLLVERGLAPTRARGQSFILSGNVFVNGQKAEKAGEAVAEDAIIEVKGKDHPYVGRGGLKLAAALDAFSIDPAKKTALDIGASTGGFTDCLLQRGAAKVVAVDVGSNQIDWKLRNDPRVTVIEEFNARNLKMEDVGGPFDIIVIDVSFISLELILPPAAAALVPGGVCIALVKPQFEAGREEVGSGGIVRDPKVHKRVVDKILALGSGLGLSAIGHIDSPIEGTKGNREFLAAFRKP